MRKLKTITRLLTFCLLPALVVLAALAAPLGVVLGATTLTSFRLQVSASWTYEKSVTGFTNSLASNDGLTVTLTTTNGTGAAGTADLIYFASATIAASGSTTLDLTGTLTDAFGATISMARVKIFFVYHATDTTASSVAVGNATAPVINWISAATSTVKLFNGNLWVQGGTGATQYAVTDTTADGLKVLNNDGANSATVKFVIVGSSA